MIFSNKAFDVLKWFAILFLDAVGVCYASISAIWGLPYGDEVQKTCSAVSLCLGTLLGVSTIQYKHEQAELNKEACNEMMRRNKEAIDELTGNIEDTFENFAEDGE